MDNSNLSAESQAEVDARRKAWAETVAAMSPAARDGLLQSVLDSAAALDLVCIPKARVVPVGCIVASPQHVILAPAERAQFEAVRAAQALGGEIVAAGLATREGRTAINGRREVRFDLLVIKPAPKPEPEPAP